MNKQEANNLYGSYHAIESQRQRMLNSQSQQMCGMYDSAQALHPWQIMDSTTERDESQPTPGPSIYRPELDDRPLNLRTPCWIQSKQDILDERTEAAKRFQRRLFPFLVLTLGVVVYLGVKYIHGL